MSAPSAAPLGIVRSELVRPPQRVSVRPPEGFTCGTAEVFGDLVRRDMLGGAPLNATVRLAGGVEMTCPPGWVQPCTDWHALLGLPR